MPAMEAAQIGQFELEVELDASPERAWQALTEEIDSWWLPDFRTVEKGVVRLELRAGGGLVEASPDGTELLWYTVQLVQPGQALSLIGHTAADWGGPTTSFLKLAISERQGGALLTISDSVVGRVDESKLNCQNDGWKQLFTEGLAAHLG